MVEIGGAIAWDDLVYQSDFLADLLLETVYVQTFDTLEFVPLHIEQRCGTKLGCRKTLIEFQGVDYLVYQLLRNYLPCLVMNCIFCEQFRLESPVLVELREGLHEVPLNGSSADTSVIALAEQSVKSVAELMERCRDLVHGKESRSVFIRGRKISHIHYDRSYVIAFSITVLVTEIAHPCTAPLAVTREIVTYEYADEVTVVISQFVGGSLRVV